MQVTPIFFVAAKRSEQVERRVAPLRHTPS